MNPLLPLYRIPIPTLHSRHIPKGGDFIIQLVISVQAPSPLPRPPIIPILTRQDIALIIIVKIDTMVPDNPAIFKITKSQSYLSLPHAYGERHFPFHCQF